MQSTIIAVDLAKSVFEVGVSHHPGKVAESHRLTRSQFVRFFAERKPVLVLMEACGTAHYWARKLEADHGHRVLLLPPQHVRPYVRGNKTDRADTKGLLEAYRNEEIRPVPVKSVAQQTLGALHRLRSAWLACRTARLNLLRGILREQGHAIPVGARRVVPRVLGLLAEEEQVPAALRPVLAEACAEIRSLEQRIDAVEKQLRTAAAEIPVVARLRSIPGVGLLTATALVAFVGEVLRFPTSRHFASFLGLTPREHSSGLRRRLGGISRRGDAYLRTLLIHGARAVLAAARRASKPDRLRAWALQVHRLRGHNRAAVALANKMARIVWAVWRSDRSFEPRGLGSSL